MEGLKNKLEQLLAKEEWTPEEKQWLLHYLESPETDALKELMRERFEAATATPAMDPAVSEHLLQQLHQRLGLEPPVKQAPVLRLRWWKIAAAAAVVGLLLLGASRWWGPGAEKKITAKHIFRDSQDVAPGGQKAVLTLADGSTIVLDDAQNGDLARQGTTKIIKVGGKLDYNQAGTSPKEVLFNTITTPRGGQYQVELPDGSLVWLNAASSLRFPTAFAGRERRVEITGEAYFEITKNAALPFVLAVGGSEVQVLGTHFNVMAYSEEATLKTTLLEGSVKFVSGGHTSLLRPGQQAQRTKAGDVNVVSGVNLEEVMAWKNGLFHFEKADIEAVMRQLARWYDVDVEFKNKKAFDPLYAEIPRTSKLSDVLRALELSGSAHFRIEGKKILVQQ
ncbi:FecR family protein [Paraflavisolibacter sp. H34]|uniref:FecR family protein n=1 Tax=Huijunlia imazamoxiresistens TaxID=3127457 RepID=UPI003016A5E8